MKNFDGSFLYRLRLIWSYKDVIRSHFPPVFKVFSKLFRQSQFAAACNLRGKECINVAFLLPVPGMWKLDSVFQRMSHHPKYHPYIVIFPYSTYKEFEDKEIENTLLRTEQFVKDNGYEYVIPYDMSTKQWLDVNKEYHPDIVFFCTPYKDSLPNFYIYNFRNVLTCYVQYSFCSLKNYHSNYDLAFHNLVGIHFLESTIHKDMAEEHSRNKAINAAVTGYPATEIYLREDYRPTNCWKVLSSPHKKVIWAPHHSVDYQDFVSTFLMFCDDMIRLAETHKDHIQFAFKPHQLLKLKLQQIWGTEKTEAYYNKWASMENTQLFNDGYEDLFLTSDAMIHDCGSFTTEYLFTKKPVMYLCKDADMTEKFNEFGVKAFECHYQGRTVEDIERFLQEVVISGNDPMKVQRETFFDKYLKPKDEILPSQKILQVIENVINGDTSDFDV